MRVKSIWLLGAAACLICAKKTTADPINIPETTAGVRTASLNTGPVWLCETALPTGTGATWAACIISDVVSFTRNSARLFSDKETKDDGDAADAGTGLADFIRLNPPKEGDKFLVESADPLLYSPAGGDPGGDASAVPAPTYDICSDVGTAGKAPTTCPCCVTPPVPEPSSLMMLLGAAAIIVAIVRRDSESSKVSN